MKRITKAIAGIVITVLLISGGYYLMLKEDRLVAGEQEFIIETELPNTTQSQIVYLSMERVNQSRADEIAEKLGFNDSSKTKTLDEYEVGIYRWSSEKADLEIYKESGGIFYWLSKRKEVIGTNLPTENASIEIAKKYINEFRGKTDDLELISVGYQYSYSMENETANKKEIMVSLTFKQNINGIKTEGKSGFINIDLGANGTLITYVQFIRELREINPNTTQTTDQNGTTSEPLKTRFKDVKILSAIDGINKLKERGIIINETKPDMKVLKVELVYYMEKPEKIQYEANPTWKYTLQPIADQLSDNYTITYYVDCIDGEIYDEQSF